MSPPWVTAAMTLLVGVGARRPVAVDTPRSMVSRAGRSTVKARQATAADLPWTVRTERT
jgi:hypothetical protein